MCIFWISFVVEINAYFIEVLEPFHLFSELTVSFDLKFHCVVNGGEAKMTDTADVMAVDADSVMIEVIQKIKTTNVILEWPHSLVGEEELFLKRNPYWLLIMSQICCKIFPYFYLPNFNRSFVISSQLWAVVKQNTHYLRIYSLNLWCC